MEDSRRDNSLGKTRRVLFGAAGILGLLGIGRAAAGGFRQPSTEQFSQKTINPIDGIVVRLESGRGLRSEVLVRYPGEKDVDGTVRRLLKANGTKGDYVNVDYFMPKESPSGLRGEYLGYEEGSVIDGLGWKVESVDPEKKQVVLGVQSGGKTSDLIVSVDFSDPNKKPDSFRDSSGSNRYIIVAAVGRRREQVTIGSNPTTVQIPDRVVVYREKVT